MQLPEDSPVVKVAQLQAALAAGTALRLLDARADPVNGSDPGAGRSSWLAAHLPGAVHVDLDRDLSDHRKQGQGRHPLPGEDDFAATLGRLGIGPRTAVVVYDGSDGALAAARAWWLLRLVGHRRVWVLDGGLAAWQAAGLPLSQDITPVEPLAAYPGKFDRAQLVEVQQVLDRLGQAPGWLLDARAPERFAGRSEPIDPVAGHVPGATNLPYGQLVADGRLLPPEAIRARVAQLPGGLEMAGRVLMCGSGVTACHLLLALESAGLDGARVYPGSWSGWIADPARPVAREGDA